MTSYPTSVLHAVAKDYYALCARAAKIGIPTSLDNPSSPPTVAALRKAVQDAEAR